MAEVARVLWLDHLAERRDVALARRDAVDVQFPTAEVDGGEQDFDLRGLQGDLAVLAHLQEGTELAKDTIRAVSRKVDVNRKVSSFEIYGYDFMIDEDLKPWLIEVNTNPCLELSSPYLARLIPAMLENAIK